VRLLLDTNAYVAFTLPNAKVQAIVHRSRQLLLTYVTLAELRAGFLLGDRERQNEKQLQKFLSQGVRVLYPDDSTTHHYARLFQQLRKQGTPIPTNDIWIAAIALQHDLVLCTGDRDFDRLGQLPIEWF